MKNSKKKQKKTLLNAIYNKEIKFFKRNKELYNKIGLAQFIIAIILLIIGRVCIVIMSFLFEFYLWVFNNKRFKYNVNKMYSSLNIQ